MDSAGADVVAEEEPKGGQKVGKYNMRAKSYSLVYVSAARTGGEFTTGIQTPLRRAR